MKQINKKFMLHLKEIFDISSKAELMKNLKVLKCKRNFTDDYSSDKLNKDELYYVLIIDNFYSVLLENTLLTFTSRKSILEAYFYDYFMTEKEMRKEKLIKIQQVSNSNIVAELNTNK